MEKKIKIGENTFLYLRIIETDDIQIGVISIIDAIGSYKTFMDYSHPLEYKKLCKYLDTSEKPRFLPRFKLGDNIHLDRVRSREIYDEIKDFFKPVDERREDIIKDLLNN